jgi:hypothetical protein
MAIQSKMQENYIFIEKNRFRKKLDFQSILFNGCSSFGNDSHVIRKTFFVIQFTNT